MLKQPSTADLGGRHEECLPRGAAVPGIEQQVLDALIDQHLVEADAHVFQVPEHQRHRMNEYAHAGRRAGADSVVGVDLRDEAGAILVQRRYETSFYCVSIDARKRLVVLDLVEAWSTRL